MARMQPIDDLTQRRAAKARKHACSNDGLRDAAHAAILAMCGDRGSQADCGGIDFSDQDLNIHLHVVVGAYENDETMCVMQLSITVAGDREDARRVLTTIRNKHAKSSKRRRRTTKEP